MTLKEAVASHIAAQGYTGRFFFGEQTTYDVPEHIIVSDAGSWNDDPARYFRFPTIEIVIRSRTQQGCDQLADTIYRALDVGQALQLAPSYRVCRASIPNPPASEGKDDKGVWTRSLAANFLIPFAAAI